MKTSIVTLSFLAVAMSAMAQSPRQGGQTVSAHGKYQISITSLTDERQIQEIDRRFSDAREHRRGERSLGTAVLQSLGNAFVQKTGNASSNLIDLGVSYLMESMKSETERSDFKSWYSAVTGMNTFTRQITSDEQVDDFYYFHSTNGALDPSSMKFSGFVFRNYLEEDQPSGNGQAPAAGQNRGGNRAPQGTMQPGQNNPEQRFKKTSRGKEVCYIKCSLRTDSLGLAHLANHSKFYLQIDSLVFNPKYCNLPNDSVQRNQPSYFSFDTRKDLQIQLKVKVYSSWVNQAVNYTLDQKLGEFSINARINRENLVQVGKDSLFVYSRNIGNPQIDNLVSISGESFIVPRSYVGTVDEDIWGTGQYRLDMELSERCSLNEEHYITIEHVGNTEQASYAALPGDRKWKKDVWREEWRQIKQRKKGDSFWKNAVAAVRTAYIGTSWVKEIIDPVATVLIAEETSELMDLFDIDAVQGTSGRGGGQSASGGQPAGGQAAGGGQPAGGQAAGSGQPGGGQAAGGGQPGGGQPAGGGQGMPQGGRP